MPLLDRCWTSLGSFWVPLGIILGAFGTQFGDHFGGWAQSSPKLLPSGAFWGHWGGHGPMFGLCWGQFGATRAPSRPKWEHLGAILSHFENPRGYFGDVFSRIGFRHVFCCLFDDFWFHFRSAPNAATRAGSSENAFSHFL